MSDEVGGRRQAEGPQAGHGPRLILKQARDAALYCLTLAETAVILAKGTLPPGVDLDAEGKRVFRQLSTVLESTNIIEKAGLQASWHWRAVELAHSVHATIDGYYWGRGIDQEAHRERMSIAPALAELPAGVTATDFRALEREIWHESRERESWQTRAELPPAEARQPIRDTIEARNSIRLVGDVWQLGYSTENGQYPKQGNQCIKWLAKLLAAPNRSFTIAELRGDPEGKLAADALLRGDLESDRDGVKAIKNRLEAIEAITEETGGSETLENEKANLLRWLQAADDNKQITNPLRKAHHNIATQIRNLREKLAPTMPKLAAHLQESLKLDAPHFGYYPPLGAPAWES